MSTANLHLESDNKLKIPKKGWQLPESLRAELGSGLGKIVSEDTIITELKHATKVVAIGDMSTLTLYKRGYVPNIAIVDFKVNRILDEKVKKQIEKVKSEVLKVENPAGMLTRALWNAILRAYKLKRKKVRIEVEGEEDLATPACIALGPRGAKLVYGMPGVGLAVVEINPYTKAKVRKALSMMEVA